jgi:hypothetical protein
VHLFCTFWGENSRTLMMSDVDYEANSSGPQAATWVSAMQAPGWAPALENSQS